MFDSIRLNQTRSNKKDTLLILWPVGHVFSDSSNFLFDNIISNNKGILFDLVRYILSNPYLSDSQHTQKIKYRISKSWIITFMIDLIGFGERLHFFEVGFHVAPLAFRNTIIFDHVRSAEDSIHQWEKIFNHHRIVQDFDRSSHPFVSQQTN